MSRILFDFFDGSTNGEATPAVGTITLSAPVAQAAGTVSGEANPTVPVINLSAPIATANGVIPPPVGYWDLSIVGSPAGVNKLFKEPGHAFTDQMRGLRVVAPRALARGWQVIPWEPKFRYTSKATPPVAKMRTTPPRAYASGKKVYTITDEQLHAMIMAVMIEEEAMV
jgi:hypothetical protein